MDHNNFRNQFGPTALITGAAHGIGAAFALALAKRGLNLLLVDIDQPALAATAAAITEKHPVDVQTVTADLTDEKSLQTVITAAERTNIGLLVNNAGYGHTGAFLDIDLQKHLEVLDLNVRSALVLTHHLVPLIKRQPHGGIIFTSSISALVGQPGIAHYSATKAYILSFAEALYGELNRDGIDVLAVLPGLTRTRAITAGLTPDQAKSIVAMEPRQVAEEALEALGRKPSIVPGTRPWLASIVLKLVPRKLFLKMRGNVDFSIA